jgi:hypothetical protein
LLVTEFAATGGKAVQERLSDVGQHGGVAARDEAAGGQLEEIGEELVDLGGRSEILDLACMSSGQAKKLGCARLVQRLRRPTAMVLTERGMRWGPKLTALAAQGRDVLAMVGGATFASLSVECCAGHGSSFHLGMGSRGHEATR